MTRRYLRTSDISKAVAAGTVAELETTDLSGRIGLLYGELTQAPLSPKAWFLISDREKHVIRLLEEKNPVALVAVQAKPGFLNRLIEDWEFTIPSVTVPVRTGLALLRQNNPVVHLKIDFQQQPGYSGNGVPSIALGGFGWENGTSLAHLRTDTVDWINPAKLNAVVLLLADIVDLLQDKSRAWARGRDVSVPA